MQFSTKNQNRTAENLSPWLKSHSSVTSTFFQQLLEKGFPVSISYDPARKSLSTRSILDLFTILVVTAVCTFFLNQKCLGQAGGIYDAPKKTISIDGDLSDWSGPDHGVLSHSHNNGISPLEVDILYAWDDSYLYALVQETAVDDDHAEGTDAADWMPGGDAAPWNTDSMGFYDTPGNTVCCSKQTGPYTHYWIGLSSTDITNPSQIRHMRRTAPETGDSLVAGDAANNLSTDGRRAVEFRMSWDDIRYTTASGNAVSGHSREDVEAGYQFRLDPLAVDGVDSTGFNSQAFPGGAITPDTVAEQDTSFVRLTESVVPWIWGVDSSGDWHGASNWSTDMVPNSNEHTATFSGAISSTRTVYTDTPVSVSIITFDNTNRYVIAGAGGVNIGTGSMGSRVSVTQGTHEFQTKVDLRSDSEANIAANSTLIFTNALNLNGHTLNKNGHGELAIRNDLITDGGTINVQQGMLSGNGTISGDVNNLNGTISPGNSTGSLAGVPEPATGVLLSIGLIGCLGCWRRVAVRT